MLASFKRRVKTRLYVTRSGRYVCLLFCLCAGLGLLQK